MLIRSWAIGISLVATGIRFVPVDLEVDICNQHRIYSSIIKRKNSHQPPRGSVVVVISCDRGYHLILRSFKETGYQIVICSHMKEAGYRLPSVRKFFVVILIWLLPTFFILMLSKTYVCAVTQHHPFLNRCSFMNGSNFQRSAICMQLSVVTLAYLK